jgi:Protein of unknown function (DUF1822)
VFLFADPTQLWLEIPPETQDASWQQSQSFSSPNSRWRAYLHRLCLDTFLPWLQEEYVPRARVFPHRAGVASIWEVVDGIAITMGEKRLILIPTEAIDDDELCVPQEWVDLPSWVGDYYLAVQVNPDDLMLRIWGWTTHAQLKAKGCYDRRDRTYSLERDYLIQDLSVLWLTQELCPDEMTQSVLEPLPTLPPIQAENLIQRLGNPEKITPRLEVPFSLWGALLENETWRQQLYQKRLGKTDGIRLGRWLTNRVEQGWQSIEALFPESEQLAWRFRQTRDSSESQIEQVKRIELAPQAEELAVVLLVGLKAEADGRIGIRVQLHPDPDRTYLSANLQLTLLSETGEPLKSVQSRDRDNYIQLPDFKCPSGQRFSLQVKLEDCSITEDFCV